MNIIASIHYSNKLPKATVELGNINTNESIDNYCNSLRASIAFILSKVPPIWFRPDLKIDVFIQYNPLAPIDEINATLYYNQEHLDKFIKKLKDHMQTLIEKKPKQRIIKSVSPMSSLNINLTDEKKDKTE